MIIFYSDIIPLRSITQNVDCICFKSFFSRFTAFETPDILNHLVIIIILKLTFWRLNISAVFISELIRESVWCSLPVFKASCNPFIKACYKNKFRITFMNIIPLLLEIKSIILWVFNFGIHGNGLSGIFVTVRVITVSKRTALCSLRTIHRYQSAVMYILRNTYSHHFGLTVFNSVFSLRIIGAPSPHIVLIIGILWKIRGIVCLKSEKIWYINI